jgi:putative ubiquitin-RnfH superfamily antitoxin RatB of RatAB toxin-antitoxin module
MAESIEVTVAAGLPTRQREIALAVPEGTGAREAVVLSAVAEQFPEIPVAACRLAVFGQLVADTYRLRPGDRVEVCRPLKADPRELRRELALRGRNMGSHPE